MSPRFKIRFRRVGQERAVLYGAEHQAGGAVNKLALRLASLWQQANADAELLQLFKECVPFGFIRGLQGAEDGEQEIVGWPVSHLLQLRARETGLSYQFSKVVTFSA